MEAKRIATEEEQRMPFGTQNYHSNQTLQYSLHDNLMCFCRFV